MTEFPLFENSVAVAFSLEKPSCTHTFLLRTQQRDQMSYSRANGIRGHLARGHILNQLMTDSVNDTCCGHVKKLGFKPIWQEEGEGRMIPVKQEPVSPEETKPSLEPQSMAFCDQSPAKQWPPRGYELLITREMNQKGFRTTVRSANFGQVPVRIRSTLLFAEAIWQLIKGCFMKRAHAFNGSRTLEL